MQSVSVCKKIRLLLSIRSLNNGGAERQFLELVKFLSQNPEFELYVATMYGGLYENEIKNMLKDRYVNLQKKNRYDLFGFGMQYKRWLKSIKPDVIYAFLGEMNLFSLWCKPKNTKIIWSFRASNIDYKAYGKFNQLVFWLQKVFSSRADLIISNSQSAIDFHKEQGFDVSKAIVVPNGIDTERFKRDEAKRKEFREKYKLQESDIAIGISARIDRMKGYPIFCEAVKRLSSQFPNIYFFAAGDGDENIKKECVEILGDLNEKRFFWLGYVKEIETFYGAMDIIVSSSIFGEGFSNSIAEAMACEACCVVTDVGDSAKIVGDCGFVVEPNNVESLKAGLEKATNSDFKAIGKLARERVIENFSVNEMVNKTIYNIKKVVH